MCVGDGVTGALDVVGDAVVGGAMGAGVGTRHADVDRLMVGSPKYVSPSSVHGYEAVHPVKSDDDPSQ